MQPQPDIPATLDRWTAIAQDRFGIPQLRPAQQAVLAAVLSHRDVLATLPTGSGKTLLYALPALTSTSGPVLVICPLISLMRDQVRRMTEAGIPSVLFTSDQSEEERRSAWADFNSEATRLVFVSPERLVLPSFVRALRRRGIFMAVVDEAHCVTAWGPSFRPEYTRIGQILADLQPEHVLALTATAARASRKIIIDQVFPPGRTAREIVFSPLRQNIHVEAERHPTEVLKWERLVEILRNDDFQKAIVYFPRRTLCDESARKLRQAGLHSVSYHAGLTRDERRRVEEYVHVANKPLVICATQAFGMGVDVSGITTVVVFGFPGGIEEFFQMIGRAGRGGEQSRGILLWTGADPRKREFQFEASYPSADIMTYAIGKAARHFPGTGAQRVVPETTLADAMGFDTNDTKFPGVLAALRLTGALETPIIHQSYLEIQHRTDPFRICRELPTGRTRRGLFWSSLERLVGEGWSERNVTSSVVPVPLLCEESRLSWQQCEEILIHHQDRNEISWRVVTTDPADPWHTIRGGEAEAIRGLTRYLAIRTSFSESLGQLERLARSQSCRLMAAERFFGARGEVAGAFACRQCDLCIPKHPTRRAPVFAKNADA